MDTAKLLGRKNCLHSLQGDQGQVVVTRGGELTIVLARLDVMDILVVDLQVPSLMADKEKGSLVGRPAL